jgi:hypothetical protein
VTAEWLVLFGKRSQLLFFTYFNQNERYHPDANHFSFPSSCPPQQAVAYSPHLNGEKLTQREGAIAQYNLAEAHAARIQKTTKGLFEQASLLPAYAEVLAELGPKQFAKRLHNLVKGSSAGYLAEERKLLKNTPHNWELHYTPEKGLFLRSPSLTSSPVQSFLWNQKPPKGVYKSNNGETALKIPVRGGGYNHDLLHLMLENPNGSQAGILEAITDKTQSTLPEALLGNPLKTEEQLQAIFEAAREGAPIIKKVQRLNANHEKARLALSALHKEAGEALKGLLNPAE